MPREDRSSHVRPTLTNPGSRELARRAGAYLVCLAFGATFLLSSLLGARGSTALTRGIVAGAVAFALGRMLIKPVVDVVLDAMARDQAAGEDKR